MNGKNTLSYPAHVHAIHFPEVAKFKLPKIFWGVFLFIFVAASSLLSYERIYAQKAYSGIKIAGINIGGKTQNEIESLLKEKTKEWSEQSVIISSPSETLKPKVKDLGISFDAEKQAEQVFLVGRGKNWFQSQAQLIKTIFVGTNIPLLVQIDKDKLNAFLAPFETKSEKPQNASLKIDGQNVSIIPPKEGILLDRENFIANLNDRVGYLKPEPIILSSKQAKPTILESGVLEAKGAVENLLKQSIILTYQTQTYQIGANQIAQFIKFEEKDNKLVVGFSDEEIDKYVASLAKKIDIKPVDQQILSTTGQMLDEGKDGQALDRQGTKNQIKQGLTTSAKTFELKVAEKKRGQKTINPAGTPGLFPGKYIEIVLSKQTLYAFEGDVLVKSFLISSGISRLPTPTGTFSIYTKVRSELMQGPGYYLPGVQWVNKFDGPYSIHGTYWHHNFGHPMSHGCVNATNADASFIYSWAPIGTPVYIHN